MLKRLTKYLSLLSVPLFLVVFPGCQPNPSDPVDPFLDRNKVSFEAPVNVDADIYRITICSGTEDSVMYYEYAKTNPIEIAVPVSEPSLVTVLGYKNGILVFTGSATVSAGEKLPKILTPQSIATVPPAPAAPSLAVSEGKISVAWAGCAGAEFYKLFRTLDVNLPPVLIEGSMSRVFVDSPGVAGDTVYYRVSAVNAAGESAPSAYASVTMPKPDIAPEVPQAPGIPQNVKAAATGVAAITVSWDSVAGALSYNVHRINRESLVEAKIASLQSLYFSDTGKAAGSTWGYAVSAVNAAGESGKTPVVWATTSLSNPTTPQGVQATAVSEKSISVSWTAVASASSYLVEWAVRQQGPFASATITAAPFVIPDLTASTLYFCRVTAVNTAGQSNPSTFVSATTQAPPLVAPNAPILTVTSVSDTSIQMQWPAVANAASYIIERGAAASGPFVPICTTAAPSFNDAKCTPSTVYFYRGKALNTAGSSSYSEAVSATTATRLLPPSGLKKDTVTATSIKFSWQAAVGAQSYKVYRSTTSGGQFAAICAVTATEYSDTGLTAAATYYYKVASVNETATSVLSAVFFAATAAAAPAAPTGLTLTVASSSSIAVKFTAVAGATGYKLYWSVNNGAFTAISLTATSYTHTGLTASTTYYYKVSAVKQTAESAPSSVVSAQTPAVSQKIGGINASKCTGCGECVRSCKTGAIKRSGKKYVIDPALCDGDGACVKACEKGAISLQ